jgi:long-subunit acyl-CoA synthetase (AMP-forming)
MIPELPIAMLACARIGAVHTVIFSGFSAQAICDRMGDIQAKVIITADGGYRRGKVMALKEIVDEAAKMCPCVEHIIVVKRTGQPVPMTKKRDLWLSDLMEDAEKWVEPEIVESTHPLYILYTSGTTGPPKGAMLTHTNITWMAQAMAEGNPIEDQDEFLSFLPLCHIFEQLFTIFMNIKYAAIVNFIESTDTVTDNMREVSPTVAYGVPRIWEKYYSTIMILMSDATWFKRSLFHLSLGVGKKYAALRTRRQPISLWLRLAYSLAYFSVFRKLSKIYGA